LPVSGFGSIYANAITNNWIKKMNPILKQKVFSEMNRKMNYLVNKCGS